jgi:hypothetical protein
MGKRDGKEDYKTSRLIEGVTGREKMSAACWNITGLLLALAGILLLFRYGMPYRVRSGGAIHLILEQTDDAEIKAEKRYAIFGWIGLTLIVVGTLFQIAASIPALIQ